MVLHRSIFERELEYCDVFTNWCLIVRILEGRYSGKVGYCVWGIAGLYLGLGHQTLEKQHLSHMKYGSTADRNSMCTHKN